MSVEITFEQDGGNGLVAQGTSLWEAARRLGVRLRSDCNGQGECDACAVLIIQGAELLSPVRDAEQKILGPERLGRAERLACQTSLDRAGVVIVRPAPIAASAGKKQESRTAFRDLPLKKQLGKLIEIEATTISKAVNALRGKSNAMIGKFLNLQPGNTVSRQSHKREGNATAGNRQKRTADPRMEKKE